jgi:SprT protein
MTQSVLSNQQKNLVIQETSKYITLARQLYNVEIPLIAVEFNLTGHTIGMYKHSKQARIIRYNELVFAKYFEENLRDTVPHEVAHYVVDMQYGRRKVRPHGAEWQSVMADFGADNSRTANYDLSGIPKRQYSTVPYACGCQQHDLGIRRHNKVLKRKISYHCRQCGDELVAV